MITDPTPWVSVVRSQAHFPASQPSGDPLTSTDSPQTPLTCPPTAERGLLRRHHRRCHARPHRGVAARASGDLGAAAVHVPRALLAALQTLIVQIDALTTRSPSSCMRTPRRTSSGLCSTQALRAARLLAEIGDARSRFPAPEALASLTGVAPSTRQSGKSRSIGFCWAVDRQLRDSLVEWPGPTSTAAPALEATTIRTPCACRPAPGSTSSGAAGKTVWPTTWHAAAEFNASPSTARPTPPEPVCGDTCM
jgi:hypothetical protein